MNNSKVESHLQKYQRWDLPLYGLTTKPSVAAAAKQESAVTDTANDVGPQLLKILDEESRKSEPEEK